VGRIEAEQRGRALVAKLVNPPHALMDIGIVDGLEALMERASGDDGVGAVILTGAHSERFIAHYDVGELLAGAQAGPSVTPRVARASVRIAQRRDGSAQSSGRSPPLRDCRLRAPFASQ
jgi:enoyl-CoA hydratase